MVVPTERCAVCGDDLPHLDPKAGIFCVFCNFPCPIALKPPADIEKSPLAIIGEAA